MTDPQRVPVWPVRHMSLTTDEDGTQTATYRGETIDTADADSPYDALVAQAARDAAQRPGRIKAYRVKATVDEGTFSMVIDQHGTVHDTTPGEGRNLKKIVALTTAGIVALTGVGVAFATTTGHTDTPVAQHTVVVMHTPKPSPVEAPQGVPAGYSTHALWASDVVPSQAQVAADQNTVIAATGGDIPNKLAGLNAATGKQMWQLPLPSNFQVQSGPAWTTYKGQRVVVLASADTVFVASPTGKEIARVGLPTGATLLPCPDGIVAKHDNQTQVLTSDGHFHNRATPAGSTPLGVDRHDALIAATDDGKIWRVTDERVAPDPTTAKAPKGMSVTKALGLSQGEPILAISKGNSATTYKIVRVKPDGSLRWTSSDIDGSPDSLTPSPDATWGVAGHSVIDLKTGKTAKLTDDWQTTGISNDYAYGRTQNGLLVATVKGLTKPSADQKSKVTTETGNGIGSAGGIALMVAQDGNDNRIYALIPQEKK